ncbi:phosphopyruvate hydratase [Patescibacteria group bacterium]|nr:phosphopyruvate hydratase [Patescibacteria group bacterium]MCL5797719.1 phosphopyruvate hydratase [Patescibacteria group bacterium]
MKIKRILSREILDSRGNPTVESTVFLEDGSSQSAAVPSGASTGKHEALELRDNDIKRYSGKGVTKAVGNVINKISPLLVGRDVSGQNQIDNLMLEADGTENKSNLGANSILSVSLACARAAAYSQNTPLWKYLSNLYNYKERPYFPVPQMNILNGGAHTNWQSTDLQEFMIVPLGASNFAESLQWCVEVYHTLKSVLKEKNYNTNLGDEGGFAPQLKTNAEAIDLLLFSIKKAGYTPGKDIAVSIDAAVSALFHEGKYNLKREGETFGTEELIDFYYSLCDKYPIISLEDGLDEDEWDGWSKLQNKLGQKALIVGDDLLVTNSKRLEIAIKEKACNAILVKLNQIGTLTETLDVVKKAREANFKVIISHRSGETTDDFIADLSVATNADFAKFGAPARGERVTKYNRLLAIYSAISL